MPREHYSDLVALVAVAEARSFTRAAAQLGMSQSMLSVTIRQLEARLGVRLLTRTTRSVSVTEAGERLLERVAPRLRDIEGQLRSVAESGDVPAGTVRIAAPDHVIDTLIWPRLASVLAQYPRIQLELNAEHGNVDVERSGHDFAVRWGEEQGRQVAAVRIGPDLRMAIVGAPSYLAARPLPEAPPDLIEHDCITLKPPGRSQAYAWELQKGKRQMRVKVEGRLAFNGVYQIRSAALAGCGLAYLPEYLVRPQLQAGILAPVLQSWWRKVPGYHLYHCGERGMSAAMRVVAEALRHRR